MRPRLWRALSGRLRVVVGEDPGWALDLPEHAGVVETKGGARWVGRVGPDTEFWLETLPGPELARGAATHPYTQQLLANCFPGKAPDPVDP